jgi:predicted phage gp36 major capsid-like protein
MVGFYEAGIRAGNTDGQPVPRVQKTVDSSNTLKQLVAWDYMHFEFRLAYARAEIQRYGQEIEKIGKGQGTKTQSEMAKESDEALEKLLAAMTEVERKKSDLMRSRAVEQEKSENSIEPGCGTKNRDKLHRQQAKSIFDGAEPWKEIGDWQEKMNKAFIKWQHDNPAGGGTDGFMKALGLEN